MYTGAPKFWNTVLLFEIDQRQPSSQRVTLLAE